MADSSRSEATLSTLDRAAPPSEPGCKTPPVTTDINDVHSGLNNRTLITFSFLLLLILSRPHSGGDPNILAARARDRRRRSRAPEAASHGARYAELPVYFSCDVIEHITDLCFMEAQINREMKCTLEQRSLELSALHKEKQTLAEALGRAIAENNSLISKCNQVRADCGMPYSFGVVSILNKWVVAYKEALQTLTTGNGEVNSTSALCLSISEVMCSSHHRLQS